jgi:Lar family restriction alleviation protein
MTDLKPCPFCGSDWLSLDVRPLPMGISENRYYCKQCGVRGPEVVGSFRVLEAAVEKWNQRVEKPSSQTCKEVK